MAATTNSPMTTSRSSENAYRIPDDGIVRVVNFSGGRSSGFMLARIVEAHDGRLPNSVHVLFANTGKEREETLRFIGDCEREFGVRVVWLEYRHRPGAAGGLKDPKHHFEVVDFETASRAGEPFEALIKTRRMVPNVVRRVCTSELKVRTIERYMRRSQGVAPKDFRNVLGIRYDEPRRWGKATFKECRVEYPLVLAGATLADVTAFWAAQPFDLAIPSSAGNCDLCFLKGKHKLASLIREDPARADWWIRMEEEAIQGGLDRALENPTVAQFRKRYTFRELRDFAHETPEFPGLDVEEQPISCFCGD